MLYGLSTIWSQFASGRVQLDHQLPSVPLSHATAVEPWSNAWDLEPPFSTKQLWCRFAYVHRRDLMP